MCYTGIDAHKDNCFLTTVNDAGVVVKRARLRNEPALILEYFLIFSLMNLSVWRSRWWSYASLVQVGSMCACTPGRAD